MILVCQKEMNIIYNSIKFPTKGKLILTIRL